MSGVASVHKVMAGLQGKAEWNEFLSLPLLRRRFSLLTIIDLFLVALLSLLFAFAYWQLIHCRRHRISATDLTGSEAFSGKLLRSHIHFWITARSLLLSLSSFQTNKCSGKIDRLSNLLIICHNLSNESVSMSSSGSLWSSTSVRWSNIASWSREEN